MKTFLKIDKKIKAIAESTSNDKYRKNLQNVAIKNGRAYATDGFMLASTEVDCVDVLIPKDLIKKPKLQKIYDIEVDVDDEELSVNEITHKTVMKRPNQGEFESYPKVEEILIESRKNDHFTFGLSSGVIEKLSKVLKKYGQSMVKIKVQKNNLKPIYMNAGDVEIVVMPYRVEEDE